jgi:hypothetical protein
MKIVRLSDVNNPDQPVIFDAEDFSAVSPYTQGSMVRLKSSDMPLLVHESPSLVAYMVADALDH